MFIGDKNLKIKAVVFFGLSIGLFKDLQSNNQIVHDSVQAHVRSTEEDALVAISYLSLLRGAHEVYLERGNIEPEIKCKNCMEKLLNLSEFEGGLVGAALVDLGNFKVMHLYLDDCLKVVSKGTYSEIIDFMIRVANATEQPCSQCGKRSAFWGQI